MKKRLITLTVNGDRREIAVSPTQTLNQVIRDELRLTGTKRGCTSGSCGVCTVNDEEGRAILSCISLAVEWDGRSVTTIEGVERDGRLHPLQQAFLELGAVQCGVCTPGLIMSAMGLLNRNPTADERAINEALAGAICRCTGHIKVKQAVARAVAEIAEKVEKGEKGTLPFSPSFSPLIMTRKPDLAVVGKSQPRLDGFDKLSGRSLFTDDVILPGMLQARIVRSRIAHGRIVNVDTSAAERVPGVKYILTRRDVPALSIGMYQPLFDDTVRFIGQEVACVAAVDEEAAFEAAALVKIEYEPLPVVTSMAKAMEPGAVQLHAKSPGNIAWENKESYGEPDRTLGECEIVVEGDYASNPSHNCYAEFHAVVADWSRADKLTMWSPTQSAVLFQKGLVDAFGLTEGNVRLMTLNTGGAFTGRGTLRPHHYVAAAMSRKARRPVKIRAYSDEEFLMGRAGGRNEYHFRSGAMRDGKLRVIEADLLFDNGAYVEAQTLIPYITASYIHWLHQVEAVRYRGRLIYTNNMPYWIHHGGGIAQMAYAWGQHLDAVAKEVGMDPVEFHLRNAVEKGHTTMTGTHFASCGLKECIKKAAAKSGWIRKFGKLPSGKGRAKGFSKGIGIGLSAMASGAKGRFAHDTSAAFVKVAEDGTVTLATGIPDMGQGSHTTMAIIAAEVLGIAPTDVTIIAGDTDVTPFDMGAFSQRGTFMTGNAVKAAALDAREQLAKVAAVKLECKASQLVFREHQVYPKKQPERAIPFGKLVHDTLHSKEGRAVMGRGFFNSPLARGSMAYSFGAQIAEVTVDHETGLVRVDRVTAAHDLGRAINPKAVEGQIDGQVFSGMSQVLFEELVMDDGQPLNPSRLEYKLPRSFEVPEVVHILVETIDPYGPFGAKEVGEGPIVATMAAIGNAVANALGEHIPEMPITPWRVLRALGRQGE